MAIRLIKDSLIILPDNGGTGDRFDKHFESIVEAFSYGRVVPFLGAGVNLHNCFELTPIYLAQKLAGQDASLAQLMGIPCSVCPLHPSQEPPDKCPVREGTAESSLSEPLSLEQRLSFSKMQLRFLADHFFLEKGGRAYDQFRFQYMESANKEVADAIEAEQDSNNFTVYNFLSRLPARMKLKKIARNNKEFPYQLVITTNYDDMLEQALEKMGESYDVVYYDTGFEKFIFESHTQSNEGYKIKPFHTKEEYEQEFPLVVEDDLVELAPEKRRIVILKLFGTWKNKFVVTERHFMRYWAEILTRRDALLPLKMRKVLCKSEILFLGCSHNDIDLELFWEAFLPDVQQQSKDKRWLICQSKPGEYISERWNDRGNNVKQIDCSLEYFIENLDARIEKL